MRSVGTRILKGLAWLVLAGLVVEFYLAGAALFGVTTFEPHRTLGLVLARSCCSWSLRWSPGQGGA